MQLEQLELTGGGTLTLYLRESVEAMPHFRQRPLVLVVPGGGYTHVSAREGDPVALQFAAAGYHTAVLDYDTSATIAGGTFLGTGAAGMAQTFRSAEQGVVTERVSGSAGDEIVLADASGTALLTLSPALDFQFIVLSSPDLVSSETYTLTIGGASTDVQAS